MENTLNRMADVILALNEAHSADIFPTKIQLQKFVYLADALGQIIGILKPLVGHKTYRNGPYDSAIQNAVDSLSFRGLARITDVWRTPNGALATRYEITKSGQILFDKLCGSSNFSRKVKVANLVGAELQKLGWQRIVDLVYAEPTYLSARPRGWGINLEPENGLQVTSAFLIAIMRRVVDGLENGRQATPEWISNRFFAYLSDYNLHNPSIQKLRINEFKSRAICEPEASVILSRR